MPDDTLERLRGLVLRNHRISADRLVREAPLEGLGIDSLGLVELLWNVEDEFGIKLPPDTVALHTLGDVVQHVDALVAAQQRDHAAARERAATLRAPSAP